MWNANNTLYQHRCKLTIVTNLSFSERIAIATLSFGDMYIRARFTAVYILGAYGRDILNDNGELLLSFANNHDLAIVNTFFSTPKGGVSHTFNGRGKKRIDYIPTRQRDRKLVRNVTVHPFSLLSFPFRTTTLCPHPSSFSAILPETAG